MDLGLRIPHVGPLATPAYIRQFCTTAEEAGFGSLWSVDHVVMPTHTDSLYTLNPEPTPIADGAVSRQLAPNYECLSTLLWVAGFTHRVRLGTAISILPIRNPLLNARMLASLDVFSGGRLIFGVGVGWLEEEAAAMHMPWDDRGRRSDEHIDLLRAVWTAEGDVVDFSGRFYSFGPIDPDPRPIQHPPPILVGGHSPVALRRAGTRGDGWIATGLSPQRLTEGWDTVRRHAEAAGRDPQRLALVNSVRVRVTEDADRPLADPVPEVIERLDAFRRLGVDHLMLGTRDRDPGVELAAVELLGREVAPALA
jgi:probable F420-dependent oxidoreductase